MLWRQTDASCGREWGECSATGLNLSRVVILAVHFQAALLRFSLPPELAAMSIRFLFRSAALIAACMTTACAVAPTHHSSLAGDPFTRSIWAGPPPGGSSVAVVESIIERSKDPTAPDRAAIHVRQPRVKVFLPAHPDGSAVLVLPGGGYQRVVLDKEGDETALRLAEAGVTAAVLVYRLPEAGWDADRDAPLQDAQRALRLLRCGGLARGLDSRRIGVLGFSAGGHLAAALALRESAALPGPADAIDACSARPDFAGLIYAALDMNGPSPGRTMVSPEASTLVSAHSQPMFLLHAANDATVPVANSLRMFAALKQAGVPVELHVFEQGGHGFGIARAKGKPVEVWPDLFLRWGAERGFFGRAVTTDEGLGRRARSNPKRQRAAG